MRHIVDSKQRSCATVYYPEAWLLPERWLLITKPSIVVPASVGAGNFQTCKKGALRSELPPREKERFPALCIYPQHRTAYNVPKCLPSRLGKMPVVSLERDSTGHRKQRRFTAASFFSLRARARPVIVLRISGNQINVPSSLVYFYHIFRGNMTIAGSAYHNTSNPTVVESSPKIIVTIRTSTCLTGVLNRKSSRSQAKVDKIRAEPTPRMIDCSR